LYIRAMKNRLLFFDFNYDKITVIVQFHSYSGLPNCDKLEENRRTEASDHVSQLSGRYPIWQ